MRSFVELQRSSTWSRSLLERSRNGRGSRRLTRNQTDDEWHETTIGPIRGITSSLLLKSRKHKQYVRVVCTVLTAAALDVFFGKRRHTRGRTILFLGKQYCHTYRIQEREFSFNEGKFFLYRTPGRSSVRNGFWEIPFDRTRFSRREPALLMMWTCPLLRHNRHKQRVRISTVCIWEQILWGNSHHLLSEDKEIGCKKRKRKYFFFSVFRAITRLSSYQCHDPKMIYYIIFIFESCLSHITTSIEHPYSILDTKTEGWRCHENRSRKSPEQVRNVQHHEHKPPLWHDLKEQVNDVILRELFIIKR
jgi:hypothetical protein